MNEEDLVLVELTPQEIIGRNTCFCGKRRDECVCPEFTPITPPINAYRPKLSAGERTEEL